MISNFLPGCATGGNEKQARRTMSAHSFLKPWLAAALALGISTAGGKLFAQDVPPPPPDADQQQQLPQYGAPDQGQQQAGPPPQDQGQYPPDQQGAPAPQGQALSPDQLNQLVAPIALYPDALVAQILAASTYPTQIVEADRWRQSQGNAPADQIANAANSQQWDPSVKALTAFPSVLSELDKNLQWTTDLGNAYYNQPQDVMSAVQQMRQRAQSAGNLESTQQQTISDQNGDIEIAPTNPDVVYVPAYNPWIVYGPAIAPFPGYYYAPPPGFFFGVGFFGVGFGYGIPVRPWAPWGWGWHSWGVGWGGRTVIYNRTTYITRSTTVINRGFNRPGGPPRELSGSRGSFYNRPGYQDYANRVTQGARPGSGNYVRSNPNFSNRSGAQPYNNYGRQNPGFNRPGGTPPSNGAFNGGQNRFNQQQPQRPAYNPGQNAPRSGAQQYRPSAPQQNFNRPSNNYNRPSAPAQHSAPAPHMSEPHMSAPHGGGGGGGHHR